MSKSPQKNPPSNSQAPTGRKATAQGKEPRDAALGPPPPQNSSPVGAEQLPTGWVSIVIEDCLLAYDNGRKIRQGWSPQCEGHAAETDDDWGVLKTSAIQDGHFVETANKRLPEKLEPRTHLEVEAGDLLITCAGPRSRCGVACLVRKTRPKLLISGKMYQLRADPEIIDRGLLELYLREPGTQKLIDEMKTGISDSGLNLTHSRFATLIIPLPPLNEQKRIVSKIEELFSELDSGEESLRRARRQLGVYRQSLLKQAFEGKLTAPWRQQNPHLLESPEQLLKRIQAERQARYDQQMQEWETIDRKNSKKSKPPKPKNTAPLEKDVAAKLPELPPCWRWHSLAGVCNVLCGYAFKSGDFIEAGVPVIKIANVSYGEFVIKTQEYLHERFLVENVEFIIRPGDLLIALTRPITNNKTKVCEYPINQPVALLNQRVAALKTPDVSSRYMMLYALSSHFRDSIRSKFSETLQPNLSPKDLSDTPFPLCSLPEQQEIVRLLDEQFTVIAQNEQEIDAALKRSEALRQSILKKAFTGQLVPQDPNDEHASTLLERIRREREQATATQPKKKTAAKHG